MSLQDGKRGCSQAGHTNHGIIGWKKPLRSSSPTIHPTPLCPLNTPPPPPAQVPWRCKLDGIQESIPGKMRKGFCPALTCCQRQGTVLGIALPWPSTTLPKESSPPPPQTHRSLSRQKSFFNVLCNPLLSSPGAASVVVGHPLDTIKVNHFEPSPPKAPPAGRWPLSR